MFIHGLYSIVLPDTRKMHLLAEALTSLVNKKNENTEQCDSLAEQIRLTLFQARFVIQNIIVSARIKIPKKLHS
jgi:hypothetical protein